MTQGYAAVTRRYMTLWGHPTSLGFHARTNDYIWLTRAVLLCPQLHAAFASGDWSIATLQVAAEIKPTGSTEDICKWHHARRPARQKASSRQSSDLTTHGTIDVWRILISNHCGTAVAVVWVLCSLSLLRGSLSVAQSTSRASGHGARRLVGLAAWRRRRRRRLTRRPLPPMVWSWVPRTPNPGWRGGWQPDLDALGKKSWMSIRCAACGNFLLLIRADWRSSSWRNVGGCWTVWDCKSFIEIVEWFL